MHVRVKFFIKNFHDDLDLLLGDKDATFVLFSISPLYQTRLICRNHIFKPFDLYRIICELSLGHLYFDVVNRSECLPLVDFKVSLTSASLTTFLEAFNLDINVVYFQITASCFILQ